MPTSRAWPWTLGAVFLMWLFGSSLLVGAQDGITHPDEVRALRAIWRTLIDPNRNLSNWNRGDPCTSRWTGVLCFNGTQDDGYLHVRELPTALRDRKAIGKVMIVFDDMGRSKL